MSASATRPRRTRDSSVSPHSVRALPRNSTGSVGQTPFQKSSARDRKLTTALRSRASPRYSATFATLHAHTTTAAAAAHVVSRRQFGPRQAAWRVARTMAARTRIVMWHVAAMPTDAAASAITDQALVSPSRTRIRQMAHTNA